MEKVEALACPGSAFAVPSAAYIASCCHSCRRAISWTFAGHSEDAEAVRCVGEGPWCPGNGEGGFAFTSSPSTFWSEDEPYTTYDQPQDFMMQTLNQQSSALTALVAHLTTGGEGLLDIGSSSSSSTTGTRGLQRRERLITELAGGSSTFFLQFQQQLYRKMNPSVPAPRTEEEIQRNPPSLLNYLERNGGFRTQRTLGLVLWMLAYAVDAGARGDDHMMKEHLVLAVTAIEQCAVDQGEWGLGFLLSLAADPPVHLFQDRSNTVSMQHRTFGGLVPPAWSTVAVAYLREMEVLNSKKQDLSKKTKSVDDEEENPSPRRRQRFPRRPKAKAKAET